MAFKKIDRFSIVYKLIKNAPQLKKGADELLTDKYVFSSFERALVSLKNAKNADNLLAAEAGFQVAINEICRSSETESPFLSKDKTALYLYTLQGMVMCLSDWEFTNGNQNDYLPAISRKFYRALKVAGDNGINPESVRNRCFTDRFQDENDPNLKNFDFLDERKLTETLKCLDKYQLTKDQELLQELGLELIDHANVNSASSAQVNVRRGNEVNDALLDRVIAVIKSNYGKEKLSFNFIRNHLDEFYEILGTVVHTDEREKIAAITELIVRRIMTYEQAMDHNYQNIPAPSAHLDPFEPTREK